MMIFQSYNSAMSFLNFEKKILLFFARTFKTKKNLVLKKKTTSFSFTTECNTTKYKANCSEKCDPICGGPQDACGILNGWCIAGCVDGYQGEKCSYSNININGYKEKKKKKHFKLHDANCYFFHFVPYTGQSYIISIFKFLDF